MGKAVERDGEIAGWPWPVRLWVQAGLPLVFRADYDKPRRCPAWSGPALSWPRREYGCRNGMFTEAYIRWGWAANLMFLRCPECGNVRLPNFRYLVKPLRLLRDFAQSIMRERELRRVAQRRMAARRLEADYINPSRLEGVTVEEATAVAVLAEYELHIYRVDGRQMEETCVVPAQKEREYPTHEIWATTRKGRLRRVEVF